MLGDLGDKDVTHLRLELEWDRREGRLLDLCIKCSIGVGLGIR